MNQNNIIKKALAAAFPHTIPVLTGYLFLGISYGFYMKASGFPFWYPLIMSLFIYAGSMQFVTVNLLLSPYNPLQSFLIGLMINARHLFYGLSMLNKYQNTGWKKIYLIFGLTDETFSVNCSVDVPEGIDQGWFMFFVTLLDQFYWTLASVLGALFGSFITFNTKGIEFVMTAMFVVIFVDQWLQSKNHTSALVGMIISFLCLGLLGSDKFIIPAMIAMVLCLAALRNNLEGKVKA